ncbi:MAG: biotin--[acetyl-CoA-carboxylase] ligase [Campylobacterales bacterium]|nr:biotin--[acetyl-CoA-carboxylase] ligase [Campylobacterales bacterium]
MQILYFNELESTQLYLKTLLKKKELSAPIAITCGVQTKGIGSRNNEWKGSNGNLFVSFAYSLQELPVDLKVESASIYFSYILKETLAEFSSKVWLKWPNDLYIGDAKVGGMITTLVEENIVCGFGLNLNSAPENFTKLDVTIDKNLLLKQYFKNLEKKLLWKQVFSKYKLEFEQNKTYFTHVNSEKVSVESATLESDGSLLINGERIYSLR